MSNDANKPRTPSASIPEKYRDLVEKPTFLVLATVMPDGEPQATPVWFEYDGTYFVVNSAKGRVKDRNMRSNSRVAGCIIDPQNSYRYLSFQGFVVEITEEGAEDHIHFLSRRYTGNDYKLSGETRVKYFIHIENTATMG